MAEEKKKLSGEGWDELEVATKAVAGRNFFLKNEGDSAKIFFISKSPTKSYQHKIQDMNFKAVTCRGEDCPLCEIGSKPSYTGHFKILDLTDKKVKILSRGIKDCNVFRGIAEEYADGLHQCGFTIKKVGREKDTTYQLIPQPDLRYTPELEAQLEKMGAEVDLIAYIAPKSRTEIMGMMNKKLLTEKNPVKFDDGKEETKEVIKL